MIHHGTWWCRLLKHNIPWNMVIFYDTGWYTMIHDDTGLKIIIYIMIHYDTCNTLWYIIIQTETPWYNMINDDMLHNDTGWNPVINTNKHWPTWSPDSWYRQPAYPREEKDRSWVRGSKRACTGSASESPEIQVVQTYVLQNHNIFQILGFSQFRLSFSISLDFSKF